MEGLGGPLTRSGCRFIVRAIPEGHMFGGISFIWEISVTGSPWPPDVSEASNAPGSVAPADV